MSEYKFVSKCDYDSDGASTIKRFVSGEPAPYKNIILSYMRKFPCIAAAAGTIYDKISGEDTGIPILAYSADGYFWDTCDIYYLDKYNAQLNEDFVTHVIG